MPIYEYECERCRHRFERRQSILDEPIKACPQCTGSTRRLIHPVGIVFKTGGFYVTDNRPKPKDESETKTTVSTSTAAGTSTSASTASSSEVASAKKE